MQDRNSHFATPHWASVTAVGTLLATAVLVYIVHAGLTHCDHHPQRPGCSNNLHQLGLAFGSYTSDWDDKFPVSDNWPQLMEKYIKSLRIYTCPESSPRSGTRLKIREDDPEARVTYSMNRRMKGLSIHDVDRPEDTVALFESTGEKLVGGPELLPKEVRHEEKHTLAPSHAMVNVLFADGHVKEVPIDDVPKLKWDPK